MTIRDKKAIKELYFINRYLPASLSVLFGLSKPRIKEILDEEINITFTSSSDCQLCSSEDALAFHIDGNEDNNKPQNKIMLCEADKRRIIHLQLRRRQGIIKYPL